MARTNEQNTVAELRAALEERDARIAELEAELRDAHELLDLASAFVDALTEYVDGSTSDRPERASADRRREPTDAGNRGTSSNGTERTGSEDAFAAFGELMGDDGGSAAAEDTDGDSSGDTDGMFAAFADIGGGSREVGGSATSTTGERTARPTQTDGGLTVQSFSSELAEFEGGVESVGGERGVDDGADGRPAVVAELDATFEDLDDEAIELLRLYREEGPETPADAYHAVAGRQDRVSAYGLNRALRRAGLVEHVSRGHYDYRLRERIESGLDGRRDEGMASVYARDLEQQYLD